MKNYRNRIFVLCFFAIGIPLMAAGIISYRIYVKDTTKQNNLSMKAVQIQLEDDMESVLSEIHQYYLTESREEEIGWLAKTGSIPYSQYTYLNAAQEVLSGSSYLLDYIEGYAFINVKEGWTITNRGMFRNSDINNPDQFVRFLERASDHLSIVYWENNLADISFSVESPRKSNTLDFSGFQMVLKLPGTVSRIDQILAVKLDYAKLLQVARQGKIEQYYICILNESGQILVCPDSVLAEYCISHMEALKYMEGTQEITLADGRKFRVNIEQAAKSGMYYLIGYDVINVTEGGTRIIGVSLTILAIVTAVILLCRLLTHILYRPVGELEQYVTSVVAEKRDAVERTDEFSRIRNSVGQIVNERRGLQEMIAQQQKILQEQFLVRAVRGGLTSKEVTDGQKEFMLETFKCYRMLACMIMLEDETEADSSLGQEAVSLMAVRQMPVKLKQRMTAQPFCYEGRIMIIVGGQEEAALLETVEQIQGEMKEYIREQFGYMVITGVSCVFPKLKYLRTACNECMEALRNTGSGNQGELTYYDKISKNDGIIDSYDFVLESAMVKAVDGGNREEAAELADKFVNSLNNRCIRHYDRSLYLYRLVVSVLSLLTDAGLSVNQVYGEDFRAEDPLIQIQYIYESDRLKQYLEQKIILPAIDALHQYRYDSSSDILRRVIDLIHDTKGDITMGECAEQLNYHPSYLWKVIKLERNTTFTDLVNEEKIEEAKQLLAHSDYSVAEIAERLHYSNSQNFIRFFSKYAKTTPGKYRKEYNANNQ